MADRSQRRASAFRDKSFLWRAEDSPNETVRTSALFVVHGIGRQTHVQTAVTLRNGIENVIDELHSVDGPGQLPAPYISDGFWGDYHDVKTTFSDDWKAFNDLEQKFFDQLWRRRATSRFSTYGWLCGQALKLPFHANVRGFWRRLFYLPVSLVTVVLLTVFLVRHPKIMREVLADIRLYLAPRGVVEEAMVQRIEQRVAERFLRLLNLDRRFDELPEKDRLRVSGREHTFRKVTWVAHSLGTVISYNVLSDLLRECEAHKAAAAKPDAPPQAAARAANADRVLDSLHRFITLGSPLQKVATLYGESVLRPWPASALGLREGKGKDGRSPARHFWVNFFDAMDPVSGRLRDARYFPGARSEASLVTNVHGKFRPRIVSAHTSYWRQRPIQKYIVTRAYGDKVLKPAPGHEGEDPDALPAARNPKAAQRRHWRSLGLRHEDSTAMWRVAAPAATAAFLGAALWAILRFDLWVHAGKVLAFFS